jgi:hydrogenase-4 component E
MNSGFAWAMVALGLLVIFVRRRSHAIMLVALQAAVLAAGGISISGGRSAEFLVASLILLLRAAAPCALFAFSVFRTREAEPVRSRISPLTRLTLVVAVLLVVAAFTPSFGLTTRAAEQASVGLLVIGAATVVSRRPTIFHLLGLLMAENGVALAALSVPRGVPLVVELGVALDLIVVLTVAAAFHSRIFSEFGTGDTKHLRTLRD